MYLRLKYTLELTKVDGVVIVVSGPNRNRVAVDVVPVRAIAPTHTTCSTDFRHIQPMSRREPQVSTTANGVFSHTYNVGVSGCEPSSGSRALTPPRLDGYITIGCSLVTRLLREHCI